MFPCAFRRWFAPFLAVALNVSAAKPQSLLESTQNSRFTFIQTGRWERLGTKTQASLTSLLAVALSGARSRLAVSAPTVDVATANPGADIERSACVTVAIRANLAYECADLRVSYAYPVIRTFNKARAVTLLYNSQHAKPTTSVTQRHVLHVHSP